MTEQKKNQISFRKEVLRWTDRFYCLVDFLRDGIFFMSKVRPAQPAQKWVRDGIFESRGKNQMASDLIVHRKNENNNNPRWMGVEEERSNWARSIVKFTQCVYEVKL